MLFYQMRLLNSKFQICRVRSLLENVYGNANLDIQQRQDIDAETYKRMIPGLAIPNMFPHDSGLDMALIMPPKALYGVLRVNDLIYAWNQIISSSNYYDNPIPGDIQETQFGMLEMKERLINETSKRLEAETDHYFTYEQQDKNRP